MMINKIYSVHWFLYIPERTQNLHMTWLWLSTTWSSLSISGRKLTA